MTGRWFEFTGIFAVSAILCLLLTPSLGRLAIRYRLFDWPDSYKGHNQPTPYLGGLAIAVSFSLAIVFAALESPPASGRDELFFVLVAAVVLAGLGLLDDLKGLPVWPRVALELCAGLMLWQLDVGVGLSGIDSVDFMLTLLWVLGVTNAFNLLDNMDGLAAGIGAICCGSIFVIAVSTGQFLVAGMAAGLAGCSLGFLAENFHPARIFMGDAGALYLGFLVAYLGIKLKVPGEGIDTFLVPVLICSMALFDTTLVVVSRLLANRSPFRGGQDHLSHRFVRLGIPVPVAVGLAYLGTAMTGVVALIVSRVDPLSSWILGSLTFAVMTVAGGLLLRVRVYTDK